MWTTIKDCGKQLTIHSKLRETNTNHFKVYDIIEIEFDQYKLELISKDDVPAAEMLHTVLSCEQLIQYQFEVEEKET
jgi:hypothetical protein